MELTAPPTLQALPFCIPMQEIRLGLKQIAPTPGSQPFSGSTWRGALGAALRENHCLTGQKDCRNCPVAEQCILPALYDNQIPGQAGGILSRYQNAPQPYALHVPDTRQATGQLLMRLFGHHAQNSERCAHALITATSRFLKQPRYQISRLDIGTHTLAPNAAPAAPDGPIRIQLQSPLQLREQSRLVTPETLRFTTWFTTLLRRASTLQRYYTDTPLDADFAHLKARARSIAIEHQQLSRFSQQRWSNRKGKAMPMTGIVGHFDINLSPAPELWPLIWAGQKLQTGRLTTMGFGSYRIELASLPNNQTQPKSCDKGPESNGASS